MSPAKINRSREGLEQARYEYCKELYEREQLRRESLERKAQFHITLITLFLGVMSLRTEFFTDLQSAVASGELMPAAAQVLLGVAIVFGASLLMSFVAVLFAVRIRGYTPEYVANPSTKLFFERDGFITPYTLKGFYRRIGKTYAIALEGDSRVNNLKSRWLVIATYSLLLMIVSFALLFVGSIYIQF